MILCLIMLF